jgi:hypothetical protein
MDDTNPEWNRREKAQKAPEIWVFAPFAPFALHSAVRMCKSPICK